MLPLRHFNSLAPCGANRREPVLQRRNGFISTHSPRVGRTIGSCGCSAPSANFNSLAPCGANLVVVCVQPFAVEDFNSLAPCGANPDTQGFFDQLLAISTHSPRVGRTIGRSILKRYCKISTHSPRVGRTVINTFFLIRKIKFQLTRPVWGEPIHLR